MSDSHRHYCRMEERMIYQEASLSAKEHKDSATGYVSGYAHLDGEVEPAMSWKCQKCGSHNTYLEARQVSTGLQSWRVCRPCRHQQLLWSTEGHYLGLEQKAADLLNREFPSVVKDRTKARFDLLPWGPLWEVADVFTHGATQPGRVPHNWRRGTEWSDYFAAMQRHMAAYQQGEDRDAKSKLHHLAHAVACGLILLEYQLAGLGTDDRFPVAKTYTGS